MNGVFISFFNSIVMVAIVAIFVVIFAVGGKPIRKATKEEEEAMRRKPFD